MLLLALRDNPYYYYRILRVIVLAIGIFNFIVLEKTKFKWGILGVVIIFNPIDPIYISKQVWRFIDVIAAVIFIIPLLLDKKGILRGF